MERATREVHLHLVGVQVDVVENGNSFDRLLDDLRSPTCLLTGVVTLPALKAEVALKVSAAAAEDVYGFHGLVCPVGWIPEREYERGWETWQKLQAPTSKLQRSTKLRASNEVARAFELGIWSFARIAAARGGEVAQAAFHSAVAVCR